jgi:hypothetical protein
VVVFGRSPQKLAKIGGEFGFATSTDLDGLIADGSVDLVDICLPTALHAEVAIGAMQAGKDVLIELPLAATLADARRIVETQQANGRMALVDMFSRFSPANQQLRQAVADQRYGPLMVLEIEGRTTLLWPGTGQRPASAGTHPGRLPAPPPASGLTASARRRRSVRRSGGSACVIHSFCCPAGGRQASLRKSQTKSQRRPTSGDAQRRRTTVRPGQVPTERH